MRLLTKHYLLFALLLCMFYVKGQEFSKSDSIIAHRYFMLFQDAEYQDTLKARVYSDSAIYYAYRSGDPEMIGRAHQFKGWYFQDCSRFSESNQEYYNSLAYFKKAKNQQGVADAYGNLGNSYLDLNEYQKSLDYQLLSLEENEKILKKKLSDEERDWAMQGRTYAMHNIASLYQDIDLNDKALEYERKSIGYEIKSKNYVGVAISYNTLGVIHKRIGNLDSAEYYFKKALKIYETNDYPYGLAGTYQAYADLDNSELSDAQRRKMQIDALQIRRKIGDVDGEMRLLLDIAETQFDELPLDSLSDILEAVHYNIEANNLNLLNEKYFRLYSRYSSRIGKYDSAYFALENFLELKAVSDEKKRTNDLVAQDIRYQLMTKNVNDSLQLVHGFAEERLKTQEDLNKKQNYIYLSVIGLLIVLVSLFYFVQSNRRNKRMTILLSDKNKLIQEQKEMVEETNKSISDSINYAKRLQRAILPTREMVNSYLPDSFLFFKPKDVVSGDFHWFYTKNNFIYLAVADCTGHGVPGAMVSVVCSNALNSAVSEFDLEEPKEILDKTRELVIEQFAAGDGAVTDGMDLALCAIDLKKMKLIFAGANNPLWLVRSKTDASSFDPSWVLIDTEISLIEFKGDKQPIGEHANKQPFSQKEIDLLKGDVLYLFTDGFADQFGGPKGKKFKYLPLKRELLKIQTKTMQEQGSYLKELFAEWKGELEQVDDVCILGVRIN